MRLTSFNAATMGEAMAMVRRALGDEAIIVTTRKDGSGVRITAAIDGSPVTAATTLAAGDDDANGAGAAAEVVPAVRQALAKHGVQAAMVDTLLATVHDTVGQRTSVSPAVALAAALDACLRFEPVSERAERPLMLVGEPGVGKTTTVAKLAAQARLDGRSVRVITTDTVKSGGIAQLAALTDALRLGLRTAEDPAELAAAVASGANGDITVIDTCGVNPFASDEMARLAGLLKQARAEPVLVMAAGADIVDAAEGGRAFAGLGCRRAIVTRLDIARRLGSVLGAAHIAALALADGAIAPTIGSGLTALSPVALARLLLHKADNPIIASSAQKASRHG